jgi:heat-inducible transcriptional repressor
MLTERQKMLLNLVVGEYIQTASPIGSHTLVQRHRLNLSSATVRNEMVELEEAGYVTRPHSSGGAMPTDQGYRLYVESLLATAVLSTQEENTIRHQFHQVEMELEQWSRLAAAVMARMAQNVALVTMPRASETRWRRLELILLHESVILTILISQEGLVRQQMMHAAEQVSQEELNTFANLLNATLAGLTSRQVREAPLPQGGWRGAVIAEALDMMAAADAAAQERPYIEGLSLMLSQPEFSSTDRVQGIVAALEEGRFLRQLVSDIARNERLRIVIGAENPEDAMRQCTLLLANYGVEGNAVGIIGLLGPRRMDYRRTIPMLGYVASLLTELNANLMD